MTDGAPTSADFPVPLRNSDTDRIAPLNDGASPSRFGEAAHLLDRLDLRPQAQRLPQRPWWRIW